MGANYTWFLEELEKKNISIKEKILPLENTELLREAV